MVIVVLAVHPFVSDTLYVYVPAITVRFPCPIYPGVPPEALILITAVPPLHNTGETKVELATNKVGWLIKIEVVSWQP